MSNEKILNDIDEELEEIEVEKEKNNLLELYSNYKGKDEIVSSREMIKKNSFRKDEEEEKILTNLPKLNELTEGFRTGEVVVISAQTKQGKTSLLQSFTHDFIQNDIPVLWFSYEMRQQDFLRKFGEPCPEFALPKNLTGNSIEWIEKRIIESIAKYGTKAICIDHLHYLLSMQDVKNRGGISLLIGALMRELVRIAREWNVCIFLIAHTTKLDYNQKPEISDIRDSSFLAQEASIVLMLWRLKKQGDEGFSNESKLSVGANRRNGNTGVVNIIYEQGRFNEKDSIH